MVFSLLIAIALIAHASAALSSHIGLLRASALAQQSSSACNGKYKGGVAPSPEEIKQVLEKHGEWMKDHPEPDPQPSNDRRIANFCEANMEKVVLEGASLKGANFEHANLTASRLQGANLDFADMEGASLYRAHLEGASLLGTRLKLSQLREAHLERAFLKAANLTSAQMVIAHLENAVLYRAEVEGANLGGAYLEYAILRDADFKYAYLGEADLEGTQATLADFEDANLEQANLTRANLEYANLERAQLEKTRLEKANLAEARVAGAVFDLLPDSLPDIITLYSTQGLELLKFSTQPAGLVKLRNQFKDLGLRTQENQLTCAIKRSELERTDLYDKTLFVHGRLERILNYLFFDLTCQYGLSPNRPIYIVMSLAVVFSVAYLLSQRCQWGSGGIWAVWEEHRIDRREGCNSPQRLTEGFPSNQYRGRMRRISSILGLAAYFSILSALRIGWHELNIGTWISRIQRREYSLRATGWVRVVSGIQSLISIYLFVLAILTYFGTPFEF